MKTFWKILAAVVVLAVLAGAGWMVYNYTSTGEERVFRTEKIARGDLMNVISSSGTVEPEELVNVGAQVSGKIMNFGTDGEGKAVDYGSKVKKGMLLAQIDDVLYEAALREAKAEKLQAEVAILSAQASLKQAKAQLVLAERNFKRAQDLTPRGAMSRGDYDSSEAEYMVRKATVSVAEAACEQAKAKLAIAEASFDKAKRNLDYCVIRSPVDGVIIDRRVSIGQTLVSSMSASSIFLIAKDLKKMQVWVSVNEADIGSIKVGMPVLFNVDAFPGVEFTGKVHKIRLNATMSQNVVTYVVEVSTDNSNGKLLPYLTANVKFIRARSVKALNVSNAALRFRPEEAMVAPEGLELYRKASADRKMRLLWLPAAEGKVRPVAVKTGLNNGIATEVISDKIKEGDEIVTSVQLLTADEAAARKKGGASRSPFLPEVPKRRSNNPNRPAR